MSEVHDLRLDRIEEDVREIKTRLSRVEEVVVRIEAMLTATLPHLATKAELADLRAETGQGLADLRGEIGRRPPDFLP